MASFDNGPTGIHTNTRGSGPIGPWSSGHGPKVLRQADWIQRLARIHREKGVTKRHFDLVFDVITELCPEECSDTLEVERAAIKRFYDSTDRTNPVPILAIEALYLDAPADLASCTRLNDDICTAGQKHSSWPPQRWTSRMERIFSARTDGTTPSASVADPDPSEPTTQPAHQPQVSSDPENIAETQDGNHLPSDTLTSVGIIDPVPAGSTIQPTSLGPENTTETQDGTRLVSGTLSNVGTALNVDQPTGEGPMQDPGHRRLSQVTKVPTPTANPGIVSQTRLDPYTQEIDPSLRRSGSHTNGGRLPTLSWGQDWTHGNSPVNPVPSTERPYGPSERFDRPELGHMSYTNATYLPSNRNIQISRNEGGSSENRYLDGPQGLAHIHRTSNFGHNGLDRGHPTSEYHTHSGDRGHLRPNQNHRYHPYHSLPRDSISTSDIRNSTNLAQSGFRLQSQPPRISDQNFADFEYSGFSAPQRERTIYGGSHGHRDPDDHWHRALQNSGRNHSQGPILFQGSLQHLSAPGQSTTSSHESGLRETNTIITRNGPRHQNGTDYPGQSQ
ncbi:hypothetical protein AB5N19_13485 [Seiridium cardinale]